MIRIQSHPHTKAHQIIHRKVFDQQNNVIISTVQLGNAFPGSDNVINFNTTRNTWQICKDKVKRVIFNYVMSITYYTNNYVRFHVNR